MEKIKQIASWIKFQGVEIAQKTLEEKLTEVYNQGRLDMYYEQVEDTLDNILFNTRRRIGAEKKRLQEKNFYNIPLEDDVIKMRAYEYLCENLGEIVKSYRENDRKDNDS